MMLMAASWPSNKLAAVTILTLFLGLYGGGAWCPARLGFLISDFSLVVEALMLAWSG
jgi:predicted anti-sigma-YlaC factor YlaD